MPAAIPAIIGAVISAAGAGYGIESSEAAASKMNQDTSNVVGQLQGLQKQATPIYQANLQKATSPQTSQQGQQTALQQYQRVGALPATTAPEGVVNAPPSKAVDARTQANVQRQTQANAAVEQYPALTTGWNVGNALTNAKLGNIGAIGQSVTSTLPANLSLDQAQGNVGTSIGNAIGSVGGTVGAYGASQGANASNTALMQRLAALANQNNSSSSWAIDNG